MNSHNFGMDVHKANIVIVVLDNNGKVVLQSIITTSSQTARDYFTA